MNNDSNLKACDCMPDCETTIYDTQVLKLNCENSPPNYYIPGGGAECGTGNGIIGRSGRTNQCRLFFHFLCDILQPHLVHIWYICHTVNCGMRVSVFSLQKFRFSALWWPNQQKFGTLLTWPKVISPPKNLPNLSADGQENATFSLKFTNPHAAIPISDHKWWKNSQFIWWE